MMVDISEINPKFLAVCGRCGEYHMKRSMVTISARNGCQAATKTLMHLCRRCWVNFLDDYGLAEP